MTANMNWVDYVIVAIFFLSMLAGFGRGLVKEVVSILTLIAAFVVATLFASPLASAFANSSSVQSAVGQASNAMGVNAAHPVSYAALGISFAMLFAGTILVGWVIGFLLNLAFKTGMLGIGNRILGALFGLFRGFLINLVIIFVIQLSPLSSQPWWQQSSLIGYFEPAVQWIGNNVSPALSDLKDKFGQTLDNVNTSLQH